MSNRMGPIGDFQWMLTPADARRDNSSAILVLTVPVVVNL